MIGELCCYTILYLLLCLVIVFPPFEVTSAGLTVEQVLSSWLGSEISSFVQYHQRRTTANLVVHSLLIPGYIAMLNNTQPWIWQWLRSIHEEADMLVVGVSLVPLAVTMCLAFWWSSNSWFNHPLSKSLQHLVNTKENPNAWLGACTEINIQFRRIDKLSTPISTTSRLVVTDNWLIKVGSYRVSVMPLADTLVVLIGDTINNNINADMPVNPAVTRQLLQFTARSVTKKSSDINFRMCASLLSNLERLLVIPLLNSGQVNVEKSLTEKFMDVFVNAVLQNPVVIVQTPPDSCIGCMETPANVTLVRRCKTGDPTGTCVACNCRPLWCITCLGKWFAARQDQTKPSTWLASLAPCPTCRSVFCMLDVSLMKTERSAKEK